MFYFLSLLLTLFHWFAYAGFREAIYHSLRLSKISKTYIKKNQKGFKNYWLYNQIHQQHSLGILYYANIVFLLILAVFTVLSVLLGYLTVCKIVIIVFSILLCFLEIPILIWYARIDALIEYDKPFVLLTKKKESRGFYSSLLYIFAWLIPANFTLFCIIEAMGI